MMRKIRKNVNLTISQMARIMGLSEKNGADSIRGIEEGKRELSGPMQKVLEYLSRMDCEYIPEYMICDDVDKNSTMPSWLFHTKYPRYLTLFDVVDSKIVFIDEPLKPIECYWKEAEKVMRKHLLQP